MGGWEISTGTLPTQCECQNVKMGIKTIIVEVLLDATLVRFRTPQILRTRSSLYKIRWINQRHFLHFFHLQNLPLVSFETLPQQSSKMGLARFDDLCMVFLPTISTYVKIIIIFRITFLQLPHL